MFLCLFFPSANEKIAGAFWEKSLHFQSINYTKGIILKIIICDKIKNANFKIHETHDEFSTTNKKPFIQTISSIIIELQNVIKTCYIFINCRMHRLTLTCI